MKGQFTTCTVLVIGVLLAGLWQSPAAAQQTTPTPLRILTPEPARIDITIREIGYVEGKPDPDPSQVETLVRNNLAVASGYPLHSGRSGRIRHC